MFANRRSTITATAIAVLGVAIPASAYWTIAVNGSAQGAAASRGLSVVTVNRPTVNSDGSVAVTWSLPSSQLAGVQYRVIRVVDSAVVATVGSSVTTTTDMTAPPGTSGISYRVETILGTNWTTTSGRSLPALATVPVPTFTVTLSGASTTAGSSLTVTGLTAVSGGVTQVNYSGTKTIDWTGLSNSPSGQAPSYPSGSVSFTNGVATVSPAASFTLTPYSSADVSIVATDHSNTAIKGSRAITVNPGAANKIAFTTQPAGAVPATTFTTQPVVAVQDQYGNTRTTDSSTVTLSIKSGTPTSGSGTLSGCSGTKSSGATTFTGCKISGGGAGYQLRASNGTVTGDSNAFNVSAPFAITSPSNGATNQGKRPTIGGSGADPAGGSVTITFTATGETTVTKTAATASDGTWTYDPGTTNYLSNGVTYTVTATQGSLTSTISIST